MEIQRIIRLLPVVSNQVDTGFPDIVGAQAFFRYVLFLYHFQVDVSRMHQCICQKGDKIRTIEVVSVVTEQFHQTVSFCIECVDTECLFFLEQSFVIGLLNQTVGLLREAYIAYGIQFVTLSCVNGIAELGLFRVFGRVYLYGDISLEKTVFS